VSHRPASAPITSLEAPITSLEAPITSLEAPITSLEAPITSLEDCVQWALEGAKAPSGRVIGTEYERIAIGPDGRPLPYDGDVSICALLEALCRAYDWRPKLEGDRVIAALKGGASITLEPAGQFELSGAPLASVAAMVAERDAHLAELEAVARPLGISFCYVGINPIDTPQTAPKMPKERYKTMRAWMPNVGTLGLDMMHLTCTVQVNIDFRDEADAMTMLRLGYAATPVLIALFANSPWSRGRDAQMASFRAHVWTDVDTTRCDPGDWVYDRGTRLLDYARWAAGVPMYFAEHRGPDGVTLEHLPDGFSFADFIERGVNGREPTRADWETHVGTLFPDVRIKKHIEIRGADCVPPRLLPALPALAAGVFYDDQARDGAVALLADGLEGIDRRKLRAAACADGLDAAVGDVKVRDLAIELVGLAREGLTRRVNKGLDDASSVTYVEALDGLARGQARPLWQIAAEKLAAKPSLMSLSEP